jgi:phosphoribosylaminoimidazole-succinocarboxamide synthase
LTHNKTLQNEGKATGSVKDLKIVKKPTKETMGIGHFQFSNRYSVFDWGAMPDQIKGKGQALCLMGAYCFEQLEKRGIKTHYRGLVEKGKLISFQEIEKPTSTMEVNLVNVYKPLTRKEQGKIHYEYDLFTSKMKNYLIPLEIIYRNGLPEGSSVFKRLEQRKTSLNDLGLNHYPEPGERLAKPIFDVSTKLEETDRYITWQEAQKIAGLTAEETEEAKTLLSRVDETINEIASHAGLVNEDGKIELAFDNLRRLIVVDVVGTLDECRFTYQGLHVSKEIARQFYKNTSWFKDVEEAKKNAESQGIQDWRTITTTKPPKLDPTLKAIISEMYMSAANELTRRSLFVTPKLGEVIAKYKQYLGEKK